MAGVNTAGGGRAPSGIVGGMFVRNSSGVVELVSVSEEGEVAEYCFGSGTLLVCGLGVVLATQEDVV